MPMPTTALNMWRPSLITISKVATVSSTSASSGVMTYTTSTAHNFNAGELVTVTGASVSGYNVTNATIVSVPSSTTFTVSGSGTGSATGTIIATVKYFLSDHNRSPVQESNERIENSKRMANGLMRKYVVASKKTFSISWEMFPGLTTQTVDGYLGAMAMRSLYDSNFGKPFTLGLYAGTTSSPTQAKGTSPSPTANYTVFISDFSATINKRLGDIDYWDVSISFEEA